MPFLDPIFELLKILAGFLSPGSVFYGLGISHYLSRTSTFTKVVTWFNDTWQKSSPLTFVYGLVHEVGPIMAICLFLNVAGWGLTSIDGRPMLYLDMCGTVLCAILLGPWFGSLIGIITPFLIIAVFPAADAERISTWMLVNMAGGIIWGLMARTSRFRLYFHSSSSDHRGRIRSHLMFLFFFGIVAAGLMAIFGNMVAAEKNVALTVNTSFGIYVQDVFKAFQADDRLSNLSWFEKKVFTDVFRWLVYTVLYIPDKTISAAMGLLGAKYIFPMYAHSLTKTGESQSPLYSWLTPLATAAIYLAAPSPFYSCSSLTVRYAPLALLCLAAIYEGLRDTAAGKGSDKDVARLKKYHKGQPDHFFSALVAAVLIAAIVFIAGLSVLGPAESMTFAHSFTRIVLICLASFYVLRFCINQWVKGPNKNGGSENGTIAAPAAEKPSTGAGQTEPKKPRKRPAAKQTAKSKEKPASD